jgi:hypothetical protein
MHLGPMRALAMSGVLAMAAAQVACVDQARCAAAIDGVAQARAEGERRDRALAWLGFQQAQLAAQVNGDGEREALRRRVAMLEAENAALAARLETLAPPRAASSVKRRLDPSMPYELDRAPVSGKQEGTIFRRAIRPSRTLDPMVPYEPEAGAVTQAPTSAGPPATRTLDEDVPY